MWKVQLMITIHLFILKTLVMHSENDNIEIMINEKADEVIEELFNNFFLDIKLC